MVIKTVYGPLDVTATTKPWDLSVNVTEMKFAVPEPEARITKIPIFIPAPSSSIFRSNEPENALSFASRPREKETIKGSIVFPNLLRQCSQLRTVVGQWP